MRLLFEKNHGFNLIPKDYFDEMCKSLSLTEDASYVIQTTYYTKNYTEISKGYSARDGNDPGKDAETRRRELISHMRIRSEMEGLKVFSLSDVKCSSDVFIYSTGNSTYIYIKCNGAVMGCGVYSKDNIDDRRVKLCAAVLYFFGYINRDIDEIMLDAAVNHLIYDPKLGGTDIYKGLARDILEVDI